jgi:hypothetical protein
MCDALQEQTCADVGDEVCNILLLEELGKEPRPVRLHCYTSRFYECLDVVSLLAAA